MPLLNVIEALTERGAGFKSLKGTWAAITSPHGGLLLTVLGGEFERELIRARTDDGRKRAQARGVQFGELGRLRVCCRGAISKASHGFDEQISGADEQILGPDQSD